MCPEFWYDVSKSTVDELELLQTRFLKHLLAVGSGCSTPILMSETGDSFNGASNLAKEATILTSLGDFAKFSLS